MPFIVPAELPAVELFPQIKSGLVAGDQLMLSFLGMATSLDTIALAQAHESR